MPRSSIAAFPSVHVILLLCRQHLFQILTSGSVFCCFHRAQQEGVWPAVKKGKSEQKWADLWLKCLCKWELGPGQSLTAAGYPSVKCQHEITNYHTFSVQEVRLTLYFHKVTIVLQSCVQKEVLSGYCGIKLYQSNLAVFCNTYFNTPAFCRDLWNSCAEKTIPTQKVKGFF